jgi:hypothetical protein
MPNHSPAAAPKIEKRIKRLQANLIPHEDVTDRVCCVRTSLEKEAHIGVAIHRENSPGIWYRKSIRSHGHWWRCANSSQQMKGTRRDRKNANTPDASHDQLFDRGHATF